MIKKSCLKIEPGACAVYMGTEITLVLRWVSLFPCARSVCTALYPPKGTLTAQTNSCAGWLQLRT